MGENEMTMEMKPYEFIDEKVFVESFDGIEELVSRDGNSDNVQIPELNLPSDIRKLRWSNRGLSGLINIGNTCYANTAIQCISQILPLTYFFISQSHLKIMKHDMMQSIIVTQIADVLRMMWRKNVCVQPSGLIMSARQIAPKCGYPDLGDSRQGDFHEFYNFIIDSIHEATAIEDPYLKKINNTAILPADIRDKSPMQIITQLANAEWAKVFHHKWSPIVKSTYGQIVNVVECQTCRFSSIKCDILCHLSLQLDTRKPVMSIADALIEYTKDEILDGSEAWYCERCKEKRRAIRKLVPWKLPEYLMIVFKRFDPLTDAKINTIVEFNIDNLDLKQWAPGPGRETCVYEAAAIANHVGGRHGGHYFAFIRNQNGNWYVMDDDSISIIPPPTSRLIGPQNYGFLMRKKRT